MELKSENTSRISGVPKTSRNRKESRTVVEAGKGAMCRSWGQSQSSLGDAAANRRRNAEKSLNIYMLLLEQASRGEEGTSHRWGVPTGLYTVRGGRLGGTLLL